MDKAYNRNLIGGKRPNRKIQRYGYHVYATLSERMKAESKALDEYQKRAHVGKYKPYNTTDNG